MRASRQRARKTRASDCWLNRYLFLTVAPLSTGVRTDGQGNLTDPDSRIMPLSGGQRRAGAKPGVHPEFERCVLLHQVDYLMIVVVATLNRVQIRGKSRTGTYSTMSHSTSDQGSQS